MAMRSHFTPERKLTNLVGKTSLAEAIDLLSVVDAVVANDSGLMHIAAALHRPLLAIYGSTDPGFTPPLGKQVKIVKESVPCSPCFKRECPLPKHLCMDSISVNNVVRHLQALME